MGPESAAPTHGGSPWAPFDVASRRKSLQAFGGQLRRMVFGLSEDGAGGSGNSWRAVSAQGKVKGGRAGDGRRAKLLAPCRDVQDDLERGRTVSDD